MRFLHILCFLYYSLAAHEISDTDAKVPAATSEIECAKHCNSLSGCSNWIFEETVCILTLAPHMFVQGASDDISMLQLGGCPMWRDETCGWQVNTNLYGDCTLDRETPEQCMGYCSAGCTYIQDICEASCQPDISFEITMNTAGNLKLLQCLPPNFEAELRTELTRLWGISDESYIEVAASCEDATTITVAVSITPHSTLTPTTYLITSLTDAIHNRLDSAEYKHLSQLQLIECISGCDQCAGRCISGIAAGNSCMVDDGCGNICPDPCEGFERCFQQECRYQPHILVFILDDWGYKDIGMHGAEFNLENIEKLAHSGKVLDNYYTNPLCTPARVAFMTGRQDIELGAQTEVFLGATKGAIPKGVSTIGDAMKSIGYETYMIGKWHAGYHSVDELPNANGFDTFFGLHQGRIQYFTFSDSVVTPFLPNTITCDGEPYQVPFPLWGEDFWLNFEPVAKDYKGQYITDVLSDYTVDMIIDHHQRGEQNPLFMTIAHPAPHDPWQAPFSAINSAACANVEAGLDDRKILCGMLQVVDQGVGRIVDALGSVGYIGDTLIVFTSDNGAGIDPLPPDFQVQPAGSNAPLRGGKRHHFEGGTRVTSFVWGNPVLANTVVNNEIVGTGTVSTHLIHVSDWFLTLQAAGGVQPPDTIQTGAAFDGQQLDSSYNQWPTIKDNQAVRDLMIYEMGWPSDPPHGAVRNLQYKLYVGSNNSAADGWFDASNSAPNEAICGVFLGLGPCSFIAEEMFFEITQDPNERNPLDITKLNASQQTNYDNLKHFFNQWHSIMVPAQFETVFTIPYFAEGLPQFWNCVWAPFEQQELHPELPDFIVAPTGKCTDAVPQIRDCGQKEDWIIYAENM